jgi:hypothetical protein
MIAPTMAQHRNRVLVYLKPQNPSLDSALHSCSRVLACLLLADRLARAIKAEQTLVAIHLTTPETWRQVKDRFRKLPNRSVIIPRLRPPLPPQNLDLSYPERSRVTSLPAYPGLARSCQRSKSEGSNCE